MPLSVPVVAVMPVQLPAAATQSETIDEGQVLGTFLAASKLPSRMLLKTAGWPAVPLTTRWAPFSRMAPLSILIMSSAATVMVWLGFTVRSPVTRYPRASVALGFTWGVCQLKEFLTVTALSWMASRALPLPVFPKIDGCPVALPRFSVFEVSTIAGFFVPLLPRLLPVTRLLLSVTVSV